MTNRREFLQIGIAAGAWPLASTASFAARTGAAATVPLYKLVYDGRFEESIAFGARARELGLPVQEIRGDVTTFWYDELDSAWRAGAEDAAPSRPTAIAGLTAHGPLFCLEHLGWERRLRVVYRAEHVVTASDSVEHRLSGPLPMLRHAAQLTEAGERWPRIAADVAAQCPRGKAEIASARVASAARFNAPDGEPLYTWVIAPAVRAVEGDRT